MAIGDLYGLLGVSPSAAPDELRAAYHHTARRFHPDANPNTGANEEFKLIAAAYAVLSDPGRRAAYDADRAGTQPLVAMRHLFSRTPMPASKEAQVLYTLVDIQSAAGADLPAPPINLCIVIDRSTSMQGPRLDQVKAAVLHIVDNLRENDTFSVVTFSDRAEVIIPGRAGGLDRALAKAKISTVHAGGGTEILQGVLCGLIELHRALSPGAVNHLLLLTDGRTYGDEDDCLMLASLAATDGIGLSGLGIGDEWNDKFLDELTGRTGGTSAYIRSADQVREFIQEHVRRLGSALAERSTLQVTLDAGVVLQSAFKVSPEAGPVPLEQPLRLGSLPKDAATQVLLKFVIPALPPGSHSIARLRLDADIISVGKRHEQLAADLVVRTVVDSPGTAPPSPIVDALAKLSQYQMQERAWQEAAAGNVAAAATRLKTLGTRLLASGQTELAKLALNEASQLEQTQHPSEEAKKQIKYGTRALIAPPGDTRRRK